MVRPYSIGKSERFCNSHSNARHPFLPPSKNPFYISLISDDFELSQVYPNPFNPVTTLQYALPVESNIVISVHDIRGRLVTYLENERKSAGYYEAVWNASNHASGMYFIRMNVYGLDNKLQFNKLQKIMLVK